MTNLETIEDLIDVLEIVQDKSSGTGDLEGIVDSLSKATQLGMETTLQEKMAVITAEYEQAAQIVQQNADNTKTFIRSASTIATELEISTIGEICDIAAINTSLADIAKAGYDIDEPAVVKKLVSAKICGVEGLEIETSADLQNAIKAAEAVNYKLGLEAAVQNICDSYTIMADAGSNDEYISLAKSAVELVNETSAKYGVTVASLMSSAQEAEELEGASINAEFVQGIESIASTYAAIKANHKNDNYPEIVTTNIATIDNTVNDLAANGNANANEIISLALSDQGITTQCEFDAKAKYLTTDADTDRIFRELTSMKAPKGRQMTSEQVDAFRKIDISGARLKAAGVSDETSKEVQTLAQNLLSAFTSMALRPAETDPKAQYYATSAKDQEQAMWTGAMKAYDEMTSASISKLAMKI